ncbi:dipeptide epimerase [Iodidimonas muriae]|uniref:Dipeptide epimerase n=1 Tax=Iodidimonas muriae TaxID=261467 RepID=A0ABQ2LEC5_9PROT|nr:N-acetyl-D-Glu racemase DgcA [Iodidimonas muriae]GER07026.1 dipeptide epimerase [Kordiimonadales bacterium JCM 17843]GGO13287.1 dipeptide epimerase [Iodidimonas muriae]
MHFDHDALPPLTIDIGMESFTLLRPFRISRGSKTKADVIVATVQAEGHQGLGEAVPYPRYGETIAQSVEDVRKVARTFVQPMRHSDLEQLMPAGAARNALDCALWDWKAKKTGQTVSDLAGLPPLADVITAFTISLDRSDIMAQQAAKAAHMPLLKIKLGDAPHDAERLRAIHKAAPNARLIVDANEGWTFDALQELAPVAAACGVELIEQPLPAGEDGILEGYHAPVPLCADESFHGTISIATLAKRYSAVNIKLDKIGGLSAAIRQCRTVQSAGMDIFIGCMVGSSLAMMPALHLSPLARWVDLDGPLLLAKDRANGLTIEDGVIKVSRSGLWGFP